MVASGYVVRVEDPQDRDLLEEIERLKSELRESRMETARALGSVKAVEEQRNRATKRAGELQAKVYELQGELGDQADAIDELTFNAAKDLGTSSGRVL